MDKIAKHERILNLMARLLASSHPVPLEEIRAEVFGYQDGSPEAIRKRFERDKRALRRMGVEVVAEPAIGDQLGGYYIDRRCLLLQELRLEPNEVRMLALVSRHCPVEPGSALAANLQSALFKLQLSSPVSAGGAPTEHISRMTRRPCSSPEVYDQVATALRDQRPLTIDYRAGHKLTGGGKAPKDRRVVLPYGLGYACGHWYLIAHCVRNDEVRTFRLSRIHGVPKLSGKKGEAVPPEGFSVDEFLGEHRWAIGPGGPLRARVALGEDVYWFAREQLPDADCTPSGGKHGEGGEISVAYADADRMLGWLEQFGEHAEILEPAELVDRRQTVREEIRRRHAGAPQRPTTRSAGNSRVREAPLRSPDQARLARMIAMIPFLARRQNKGIHVEELSTLSGVPVEELLEDLNAILMCGLPPYLPDDYIGVFIDNGVITLRWADHFVAPVQLSLTEALALRLAIDRMFGENGEVAGSLRARIDAVLPENATAELATLAEQIRVASVARAGVGEPMMVALTERKKIDADYYSYSSGEMTRRRLWPLQLSEYAGVLYLTAYCELREDVRSFHTGRFRSVDVRKETFRWNEPVPPTAPGVPGSPSGERATIRFDAISANQVRDCFDESELRATSDGGLVVDMPRYTTRWFTTWLMGFGPHFEVLDPPDLRAHFAELT